MKRVKRLWLFAVMALVIALWLGSCDTIAQLFEDWEDGPEAPDTPVDDPKVEVTISFTSPSIEIALGDTVVAPYTITPDNATNETVVWASNDTGKVTVNPTTAEITGVAVGSATITATTPNGKIAALKVKVSLGIIEVYTADDWVEAFTTINDAPEGTADSPVLVTFNILGNFIATGVSAPNFTGAYKQVRLIGNKTVTLEPGSGSPYNTRSLIWVGNNQTLIIDGPTLVGNSSIRHDCPVVYLDAGSAELKSGTISGHRGDTDYGSGVHIVNNSTFTMSGGAISDNTGDGGAVRVGSGSTFEMIAGEISDNAGSGGGVYVDSNGTFTMSGGEISDNSSRGVSVFSNGVFTMMSGGTISGNAAGTRRGGGGVLVSSYGQFTMEGGEISDNTTKSGSDGGGGVYVDSNGTFTMKGGKISTNTTEDIRDGGGVYVYGEGSTFEMIDGEISGNHMARSGGGVYVGNSGMFIMENGVIKNNEVNDGGGGNDGVGGGVYVSGATSKFEMIDGEISGNTAYKSGGGVFVESAGTFTMTSGKISGNTAHKSGGGVHIGTGGTFEMGSTSGTGGGVISGNKAVFRGNEAAVTTILALALTGDGGGVSVAGGGFTMNSGEISGNTAQKSGGGVSVADGEFTMNGGEISGNTAEFSGSITGAKANSAFTGNGGGVSVAGGEFTMVNGTISGNTAEKSGGGLYIAAYVRNINNSPVASGGTVIMSGGTISGNIAKVTGTPSVAGTTVDSGDGGGVYLADYGTGTGSAPISKASTFSMTSNGTISGNTAEKSGGGLYIAEFSTFTKSGGTIYGSNATSPLKNTASANKGAAVYINNSAGTNVENTIQNNYSYTPQ